MAEDERDTPLHVRNERAILAGVERMRDDYEQRIANLERQQAQLIVKMEQVEAQVMAAIAINRGSGPTENDH